MLGSLIGSCFSVVKGAFSAWRIILKIVIAVACLVFIWYIFSKLNLFSPIGKILKSVFSGIGGVFSFIKGLSPL